MLAPQQRNPFSQLTQTQTFAIVASQQRFHQVGCQRGQLQEPADVGAINLIGIGQFSNRRVLARLQFLLPLPAAGQRNDQRMVVRLGFLILTLASGKNHLSPISSAKPHRDFDNDPITVAIHCASWVFFIECLLVHFVLQSAPVQLRFVRSRRPGTEPSQPFCQHRFRPPTIPARGAVPPGTTLPRLDPAVVAPRLPLPGRRNSSCITRGPSASTRWFEPLPHNGSEFHNQLQNPDLNPGFVSKTHEQCRVFAVVGKRPFFGLSWKSAARLI